MSVAAEFEKSMERLEEIVQTLESGKLSLEESVKLYNEGTQISKNCKLALENAQLEIKTINGKDDE
jgi:exodeoxyribonuclease VII small subunit